MACKLYCELSTNASGSNSVFEAARQTLHITVCEKVCGQTSRIRDLKKIVFLIEIPEIA